jgi:hypothetical protein
VLFTELGTPQRVAEALAREMGLRVVEANTHVLPADGSWISLLEQLGGTVAAALAAD